MSSIFDKLCSKQLISDYPSHLKNNIHYEVVMGSIAYGVSNDMSDVDIYGFAIPPKHIIFPYSYGNIYGFDNKPESFDQFQKHHIIDKDLCKEYDISIYNIVKYFKLCMENNPNMIDSLFVPTNCILHSTAIGNHVRDNRKLFLSKAVYHTYRGYAHSNLHKAKTKKHQGLQDIEKFEKQFNIPKETTYDDLIKELNNRGLM
jgi:predicted nucleotidyltransferase